MRIYEVLRASLKVTNRHAEEKRDDKRKLFHHPEPKPEPERWIQSVQCTPNDCSGVCAVCISASSTA